MGITPDGKRSTATVALFRKKKLGIDVGITGKLEPLAAVSWRKGAFALQGGAVFDRRNNWKAMPFVGLRMNL